MPIDLRCPSCQAKLRLNEAPARGTPVVCPKCDTAFAAPARTAAPKADEDDEDAPKPEAKKKKKSAGEDTKPATGDKLVSKERVHMNEFALLGIVATAMGLLILGLFLILWYLGKAAKVEDMVAMLPTDCNIVRGVNYGQMKKYPGYKGEMEKHYTGDVKAAVDELDKTIGGGADEWLNYFLVGRQLAAGGENRVLLLNSKKPLDKSALATALKGTAATEGGEQYWQLPASLSPAYLRGAAMYCPNDTTVLLFRNPGGGRLAPAVQTLLRSAVAYKTDKKDDRLHTKFGAAGKLAMRGHMWQIIRPVGGAKEYIGDLTAPVAKDNGLGKVSDTGKKAGGFGLWVTVGGRGVRLGAALECSDAESASGLVKAMQEGPLGKGDESEIPNGMKAALSVSGQSEFKEFLQNLSFRSKGEAAYLLSKMETGPEKARPLMDVFNKDFLQSGAGGGPGGGPGGMPGMPPGG